MTHIHRNYEAYSLTMKETSILSHYFTFKLYDLALSLKLSYNKVSITHMLSLKLSYNLSKTTKVKLSKASTLSKIFLSKTYFFHDSN